MEIPDPNDTTIPPEVQKKYAAERAKRLRPDGINQYVDLPTHLSDPSPLETETLPPKPRPSEAKATTHPHRRRRIRRSLLRSPNPSDKGLLRGGYHTRRRSRSIWWDMVLESIPGFDMRYRELSLHASLGRDRVHAQSEVCEWD